MGKTKFQDKWISEYPFLQPVKNDCYSAFCTICLKKFKIDGSGVSQVKSHAKCHKKSSTVSLPGQRTLVVNNSGSSAKVTLSKQPVIKQSLPPEDLRLNAEILQALHYVDSNYSFSSASTDSNRFRMMFPDSKIAQSYSQGATKIAYAIDHGIAPYLKAKIIRELKGNPFSFKFDETTTSQVKKQYDAYAQYWNEVKNEIVNVFCGSLFVGHCSAEQLLEHHLHFINGLGLDHHLHLSNGMDGPNVNLKYDRLLRNHLEMHYDTNFIDIGTCSLHPAHTAFRKGVGCLSFDIDTFLHNLHFFFTPFTSTSSIHCSVSRIGNRLF